MYDFTHCLSDSLEGITHSICTLEFENNRPLYDWFLDQLRVPCHPQQIEFARLNLTYTVLSKRKLLELVQERHVRGWDDPRMPTLSGLRRRGYTPGGHPRLLRPHRRGQGQQRRGHRPAGVLPAGGPEPPRAAGHGRAAPPEGGHRELPGRQVEELEAVNNPEDPAAGTRKVQFSRELYIEQDDFREDAAEEVLPPGAGPGGAPAARLLPSRCARVVKDPASGELVELRCTYDPRLDRLSGFYRTDIF